MAGLSEKDIASLKKEFLSFDSDGDGTISSEELANVLRSFGDEVSEDDVVTFVYARRSELVPIGTFTQYSLSHPHTLSKSTYNCKMT